MARINIDKLNIEYVLGQVESCEYQTNSPTWIKKMTKNRKTRWNRCMIVMDVVVNGETGWNKNVRSVEKDSIGRTRPSACLDWT